MAQSAGVSDVWAAYGRKYERENWDLLVRITPWSSSKVNQAESESALEIKPSYSINSFPEILEIALTSLVSRNTEAL